MTKIWIGSIYYFLNVVLHLGAFAVLFFANAPDDVTTLNYITELWQTPETKQLMLLNLKLLMANLVFALCIIFVVARSSVLLIIMTLLAWLAVILAYRSGTVGLVAYAAGAIHLSAVSFNRFRTQSEHHLS